MSWAPASRIVRGQILSLREATFVEAARVIGVTDSEDDPSHILPNIIAPLIVFATFGVATVIISRGQPELSRPRCAAAHAELGQPDQRRPLDHGPGALSVAMGSAGRDASC